VQTPRKLELDDGQRLTITWDDDVTQVLSAAQLRGACACADCRAAAETRKDALRLVAPMLVTITDARLVGSYGINFAFSPDGHNSGIFTFDQLRAVGSDVDFEPENPGSKDELA